MLPFAMQQAKASFKPAPLRLDDQGREIDEFGNAVQKPAESVTTLKVSSRLLSWRPLLDSKCGSVAAVPSSNLPEGHLSENLSAYMHGSLLQRRVAEGKRMSCYQALCQANLLCDSIIGMANDVQPPHADVATPALKCVCGPESHGAGAAQVTVNPSR